MTAVSSQSLLVIERSRMEPQMLKLIQRRWWEVGGLEADSASVREKVGEVSSEWLARFRAKKKAERQRARA